MKTFKLFATVILIAISSVSWAQPRVRVVSGLISLDDFAPTEKKYAVFTDSLDKKLKSNPNDTTALFYRSLLYLQFNSFSIKPDMASNQATANLLLARTMVVRADSLKMQSFNLKILRAQLYKELTNRYAAIETWRFNNNQLTERKKKFDHYAQLANHCYDELAELDKNNAYDYQKLKVRQ